jgi:hypothetical protein
MTGLTKRNLLRGALAAGGGLMINGMPLRLTMAQDATTFTGVTYLTPTYEALLAGINGFVEKLKEAGGDSITIDF